MFIGGYSIIDFTGVTINIGTDTGNAVVQNINPVTVNKIRNMEKPCCVTNCEITAAGATIEIAGFAPHVVQGGVHKLIFANVTIAVISDTSLQFTVS